MLALTRRVGEEVIIGDPRKPLGVIRVVEIHGDKVRLSFDFPRDMQINRKELAEQKARQDFPSNNPSPASPTPGSHLNTTPSKSIVSNNPLPPEPPPLSDHNPPKK
jgi:carbon storage regulator CsrA